MKKYRHFPNAHTYTILLNGLSTKYETGGRDKLTWTVSKLLEDKHVRPSTIHLNAVLQVCAKMKDCTLAYEYLEAFRAAGVEEEDARTYDILFKIFRILVEGEERPGMTRVKASDRELTPVARQMLDDARGIWQDVEAKWRTAHLTVDSRLLYSYVTALEKGSAEDVKQALAAICLMCDLPLHEDVEAVDAANNSKSKKVGNRVELSDQLKTVLMNMAETLNDRKVIEHYWALTRSLSSETMNAEVYEARLRSLKVAGDPDSAMSILAEMKSKNIEMRSTTIFLALQCCFTRDSVTDLRRAIKLIKTYVGPTSVEKFMTIPVITTFSRFITAGRDNMDISTGVRYLHKLDWKQMAEGCQNVPHQKQRLRETLQHLSRRTTYWLRSAKGNKSLEILFKGFARRITAVQKEYYPDDYAERARARTPSPPTARA